MSVKIVDTFIATIYVGFRDHYTKDICYYQEIYNYIQDYVDEVGLCVTVTKTEYVYTRGNEPGIIVGLINYSRFPSHQVDIEQHAITLGEKLRIKCKQMKVTIVMPDKTIMLYDPEDGK
jgi:hypothetical protein